MTGTLGSGKGGVRKAFELAVVRYALAFATVAAAFGLRKLFEPFTGTGAPFVLFFAAVTVSAVFGGPGPGVCATLLSLPIGAYIFVVRAGYHPWEAASQATLFALDGLIVVYLSLGVTRARRAAETSAAAQHDLIELAPDGFFLADLDGRLTDANQSACRMLGLERSQLIGKRVPDVFAANEAPRLEGAHAALLVPGHVERGEWQLRRSDGTLIPVDLSANILPGGRWQAYARDVSAAHQTAREGEELLAREQLARREAETANEKLRESEERFRLTIDEAPIGMALVDLDGRFARVNGALCEIVGYSVHELERLRFQDITHPEDLDSDLALLERLHRGEIARYQLEKRYIRKDGSTADILLSASILRAPDGAALYYIAQIEDITERKRAGEALRRSEQDFRSLAESMPQIVWATRPDGWNIYFNQQWVTYTGLTLEDSYGEGWITPFHPDDRPRAWEAWQRAIQYREPYALECRLRRADGVYQWWWVRGVPLLDDHDRIIKWFGTCTDIEQIKAAEQRLKESEAKFSGIVSIAADAIISIDDQQRITVFNRGAEQIFGFSAAEAIGMSLDTLIPPRWREAHRLQVARFASGDVTARRMGERGMAIAGLRKNGEEFPAEAAISKLQIGGKTLLTVALRDITERARIEKEQRLLAEAGAALTASLDYDQTLATVAHLVVRDFADWCLIEIFEDQDPAWRRKMVSRDPSKTDVCAAIEQLSIDRQRPYLLRVAVEGRRPVLMESVSSESLASATQGPEHQEALRAVNPTSLMAVPLASQGELLGMLAFISSTPGCPYRPVDLRLAEALAERAAIAIENARLYRASVQAARIRDQVLGFVAHDLRNPLAAISMQASLLRRGEGETGLRTVKAADSIQRATARMNRLIQDILDVTRIEGGHLSIERERLPAGQLVVDSVEAQGTLAASSSLELHGDVGAGLPEVWADRDRVLQVFENLIGNAAKFTKPGGRITAGAALRDGEVLFWVKDTGEGIDPAELPHVFDRLWQAQKARRGGAGLGLQIVKGIIEAHKGRIWVESDVRVGTTFYFTLPAAETAEAHPTRSEMH